MSSASAAALLDFVPDETDVLSEDVLQGLSRHPKELSSKYLYDERGSQLFEEICDLDEYYPTRTELAIMDRRVGEMAAVLGPQCLLIEYGSGSGVKTEILLEALDDPVAYVPVEISREALTASADRLAARFPGLEVLPVCADYTGDYEVPPSRRRPRRRAAYFPGSTIGNFTRAEAMSFLSHAAEVCGPGGGLLLGVDLVKDRAILEAAYDDARGVTAAFNMNLLTRLNRDLGADFDLDAFRHEAVYNDAASRIEMHLVSRRRQTVRVGDRRIEFAEGESICTEHSHKYTLESFAQLAASGGFEVERVWTDDDDLFSVQYLTVRA